MAWVLVKDSDFSTFADASEGTAGSTTAVPDWIDLDGNVAKVVSGVVILTSRVNAHINNRVLRPGAEDQRDSRIVFDTNTTTPYTNFRYAVLRHQADKSAYICFSTATAIGMAYISAAGAFNAIGSNELITTDSTHALRLDFSAVGTTPTTLTANVYDMTAGGVLLGTKIETDSTGPQIAGTAGFQVKGVVNTTYTFIRATTYKFSALIASPAGVPTSATSTVALSDLAATWTAGTPGVPTFTIAGVSGVSITSQTVTDATNATITVATGSTEGTATITDPSTGETANLIIGNFIAPTDTSVFFSPYNWYSDGTLTSMGDNNIRPTSTYGQSATGGAYVKFRFTGTSLKAVFGVTGWTANANQWPQFRYCIDGGTMSAHRLASSEGIYILATGLAAGTHTFELYIYDTYGSGGANRVTPTVAVRIQGFLLDAGATVSAADKRTGKMVIYGDSIGEGAYVKPGSANIDAQNGYHAHIGVALQCEYGNISYSGRGYKKGTPTLYDPAAPTNPANTAWQFHYTSGAQRLVSGLFSPAPDYIICTLGTNDMRTGVDPTTAVTGVIGVFRTAAPAAWIICLAPFGRWSATEIEAGVDAYIAANPTDYRVSYLDPGTTADNPVYSSLLDDGAACYSSDGLHPDALGSAIMGAISARMIKDVAAGGITVQNVTMTNVSIS